MEDFILPMCILSAFSLGLMCSIIETSFWKQLNGENQKIISSLTRRLKILSARLPKRAANGRFVSSL